MITEKMRKIYEDAGAEALLIGSEFLRTYLTGFPATDGFVVLDEKYCTLVIDARYVEAARKALKSSRVKVAEGTLREALALLGERKKIGVPFTHLSFAEGLSLREKGYELVDCTPALRTAMLVKSSDEIAKIAASCEIAEDAFNLLLPEIKEGMTETEVAAALEYLMRSLGASGTSFDTICAFGENASVPHYATGKRKLKFGDPVLIDFGCIFKGYCSDITRTFLFGDDGQHEEFKKLHATVLLAHELVKERVKAGMTGKEADAVARSYFASKGLGEQFTHSLGHGVGVRIHEAPLLSPRSEDVLAEGMVFSDEPGLYVAGKYGIRIEDTVMIKDGRVQSFMSKTSRNALIL